MAIWGSSGGTVGKTLRYLDLNWSIHHLKGWRGKSFSLDLWFSTMIFYHIYHWWRGKSWKITWIHSSHDFLPRYRGFQLQWSITDGILGCCLCLLIQGQVMFWKEQTCAKRVEEWWAQIEIRLYIYMIDRSPKNIKYAISETGISWTNFEVMEKWQWKPMN